LNNNGKIDMRGGKMMLTLALTNKDLLKMMGAKNFL
jgi:hypothetical protein